VNPVMEILDPEHGHIVVSWDPDNESEVAAARVQFEQLRQAGWLMFQTVSEFDPQCQPLEARLGIAPSDAPAEPELPVQTDGPFRPRARRTVAARPMRGG
jgi:hypothetical protein